MKNANTLRSTFTLLTVLAGVLISSTGCFFDAKGATTAASPSYSKPTFSAASADEYRAWAVE